MAIYDYQCKKCGNVHEVMHGMTVKPRVRCPVCKGICAKAISCPNVTLGKSREIWDCDYIHKVKPKFLRSKDGKTRVRYDPTKHGSHKGAESHLNKS